MERFRIFYARSLEALVEHLNSQVTTFSTPVYIGPNKPAKKGDKAFIAILDFSYHPIITREDVDMMQSASMEIVMDDLGIVLSA